jgi:6-phosphogluconolactonase
LFSTTQQKRRSFLKLSLVTAAGGALAACGLAPAAPTPTGPAAFYVGTYAGANVPGIYRCRLERADGSLARLDAARAGSNPSFLAFHPNGRTLYAVNELPGGRGQPQAAVSAFKPDDEGPPTFLNRQPVPDTETGSAPCHLTTDRQGRFLLVANYLGGSLTVYALQADGKVGELVYVLEQRGQGADPQRQAGPHAHYIALTSNNRFALHCDLGLDRVFVYAFDGETGQLEQAGETALAPGAGPRHLALDPSERYAYVLNEIDSTLAVFAFDAGSGALAPVQTISTLPEGYTGSNNAAEVCVHPSGKFVYASNRGHDSLAIYTLEGSSGRLTSVGHEPTRGRTPRHFAIDPTGTTLLAANQDSNTITSFRIDPQTGKLSYLSSLDIPSPVCLLFKPS